MPEKTFILADTTCDLDVKDLAAFPVDYIPFHIHIDGNDQLESDGVTASDVFNALDTAKVHTSPPTVEELLTKYQSIAEKGYNNLLVLQISSGMSEAFKNARTAASEFYDMDVEVIDTRLISSSLGILVHYMASRLDEFDNFQDIIWEAQRVARKIKFRFTLNTLEYLRKGGRIGGVEAAVGNMLNLKPIIGLDEKGVNHPYDKKIGWQTALNFLKKYFIKETRGYAQYIQVSYGKDDPLFEALVEDLRQNITADQFLIGRANPVIGVHTGPESISIAAL
jgi:DegV family protein with EDD domain